MLLQYGAILFNTGLQKSVSSDSGVVSVTVPVVTVKEKDMTAEVSGETKR